MSNRTWTDHVRHTWWLTTLLAMAAALRLLDAGSQSLWYDEVFTVRVIDGSWSDLLDRVRDLETTPPGYYVLLKLWSSIAGTSELALRVPSVAFGVAAVWVGARGASRHAGTRAGATAGLLLAVCPSLVWFGQEVRSYELLALAGTGLAVATLDVTRDPDVRRHTIAWSAWATLCCLSHYPGWIIVATFAVAVTIARIGRLKSTAIALVGPTLVCAATIPLLRTQAAGHRTDWISDSSLLRRAAVAPQQLLTGLDAPMQNATAGVLVLALFGLVTIAVGRSPDVRLLLAALVAAPLACVAVASIGGPDIVVSRNLIGSLGGLLIVAGIGAAAADTPRLRRLAWPTVACAAMLMLGLSLIITSDDRYQRPDWKGAVRAIPDDVHFIQVNPPMQAEVVRHYAPRFHLDVNAVVKPGDVVVVLAGDIVPGGSHTAPFPNTEASIIRGNVQRGQLREFNADEAGKSGVLLSQADDSLGA